MDSIKPKGEVTLTLERAGRIIETREINNLITNAGLAVMAGSIVSDVSTTKFDYIGIGIGTTAASVTDTTLVNEITTGGGARVATTGTRATTSVTNDTAKFSATWTFTTTFAVTEAGIFNASSAGTLLARTVFTAINVKNNDKLTVVWRVSFA